MIRSDLIARLTAERPQLTDRECEAVVSAILNRVTAALATGDRVELRYFGAFSLKDMPARAGRNPKTGVAVDVTSKRAVTFRTGRDMRARLNPQDPETTEQIVARMLMAG